jgi:hypothetical protein
LTPCTCLGDDEWEEEDDDDAEEVLDGDVAEEWEDDEDDEKYTQTFARKNIYADAESFMTKAGALCACSDPAFSLPPSSPRHTTPHHATPRDTAMISCLLFGYDDCRND